MTTFLGAAVVVLYILAVVALAAAAFYQSFEGNRLTAVVAGVAFVLMLAGGIAWMERANEGEMTGCLDAGGAWTVTGTRQGMLLVGNKVWVPHTYKVYGCVEVKR